jgi:multicomponent Na+:H+ antiporter subunit B
LTRGLRLRIFAFGALGLAALLAWGFAGLPDFGTSTSPYSELIARIGLGVRHATNLAAGTTTLDFRGIDTLGEEFILFAATLGVLALLRISRGERPVAADAEEREPTARSPSVATVASALAAPFMVLALYVVLHGHLTPGGGFQGGVVLATAWLLVYLAGARLRRGDGPRPVIAAEIGEASGAIGFALIGFGGLVFASAYLENFLPLGVAGNLLSAGTYPLLNLAVGIEVAGAVLLILGELLDQRLLEGEEQT